KAEYKKYQALQKVYDKEYAYVYGNYELYSKLKKEQDLLISEMGKKEPTLSELEKFEPSSPEAKIARARTMNICSKYNQKPADLFKEIQQGFTHFESQYR